LRFFYGMTLDRGEIPERIAYAHTPRRLPVILCADEVVRFLEAVPSFKARAALTTVYADGLRASEAVSLKVADVDSGQMVIQVRHGKGAKDRTVMLSPQLLQSRPRATESSNALALRGRQSRKVRQIPSKCHLMRRAVKLCIGSG
jgi:integrase/recombinase XerD